ncbi:hypothetical protein ADM96_37305 [Burkholderia sp. ST111]|nr:hypothetical protein ADM96_37305 [Burkholderia sp. ST111]
MVSAHSEFIASQQAVPEARAAFLPQVSFNVQDGRSTAMPDIGSYISYPTKGTTLSVKQPIFNVSEWEAFKQAKAVASEGETKFNAAEQLFMMQICESYFSLLNAEDELDLARSHIAMIREQLAMAQHRYLAGDVTIVDKQEAEADLDRAQSDEVAASNAVEDQRAELRRRTGRDIGSPRPLADDVPLAPLRESDRRYWVTEAAEHSLDVQQRQLASYIADRELARVRAMFLPTVDLTFSHSTGNLDYLNDQMLVDTAGSANSWHQGHANTVMLRLSIPLFEGFSTVSKERETRALKDKAESDLADARLQAEYQATQIFIHLANAFAQQEMLTSALAATKLALASTKTAYEVGVRVNADVLRAQDLVYSTQRDLKRTRYDIVLDHLRLRANAGELGEQDIQQANALLTNADVPSVTQ